MTIPNVASVRLVADRLRRDRLEPWLHAVGEPVGYHLVWADLSSPESEPSESEPPSVVPDVLVLDGPSLPTVEARAALLRAAQAPRFRYASLLYVEASLAERDAVGALSADDVVQAGPDQDARLARMVQAIALAPWKHAERLKARAKMLGEGRLRALPGGRRSASLPVSGLLEDARAMGPHLAQLMMQSVRAGRGAGADAAFSQVASLCAEFAEEIDAVKASLGEVPKTVSRAPTASACSASPSDEDGERLQVLARLRGAADAVGTLREAVRSSATEMRGSLEVAPSPLMETRRADVATRGDPGDGDT